MTTSIADPIYQGEGKWFKFTVIDSDGGLADLSTATFVFQVRQSVDDVSPVFEGTDYDDTDKAVGVIKVNLPASQTVLMEPGTYFAQLLTVIDADTDVDISDMVKFKIKKPVVVAPEVP
jgi:hypothetical protein